MTAVGRPSLLAEGRRMRRVLRLMRDGVPRTVAVTRAGVHRGTYARWMTTAKTAERKLEEGLPLTEGERRCYEFRDLADRAVADWEGRTVALAYHLASIRGQAHVLLDILSRHPETRERWKPASAIEVTGRSGGPIELERVDDMTDDELAARLARLERIARDRRDNPTS